MTQGTYIKLSILGLDHRFKNRNENGTQLFELKKEKESFYESLGKQFIEYNKIKNFFVFQTIL